MLTYGSSPLLTMIRLNFDLPKRSQQSPGSCLHSTHFAKTSTFPAGPLKRDLHLSTLHLAYNLQSTVVQAYEIGFVALTRESGSKQICAGGRRCSPAWGKL